RSSTHPTISLERTPDLRRSALRTCRLVEGGAQPLGELQRVVIGPEMQEDDSRLLRQHVAVNGGYVDALGAERPDHVDDLRADEGKVARDRCLAATGRLEIDAGGSAHDRRADRHSLLRDRIAAGYVDSIDTAIVGALATQDLIDLRSVEVD